MATKVKIKQLKGNLGDQVTDTSAERFVEMARSRLVEAGFDPEIVLVDAEGVPPKSPVFPDADVDFDEDLSAELVAAILEESFQDWQRSL